MLRLLRLRMCLVREIFFFRNRHDPGYLFICLISVHLISSFLIAE